MSTTILRDSDVQTFALFTIYNLTLFRRFHKTHCSDTSKEVLERIFAAFFPADVSK
jgi:hypothetical protein